MDADDTGRLIYLVLLGSVIASYFFVSNRQRLGEAARSAILWVFIILGVAVSYGLWNDISGTFVSRQSVSLSDERIEIPRDLDGHYYLTVVMDGTPIEFVVDTGATHVVLSQEDARKIGIDVENLNYLGRASTANGEVRTAAVRIKKVSIDGLEEHSVRALVNGGPLETSLLGMSFLQRFESVEIRSNELILQR